MPDLKVETFVWRYSAAEMWQVDRYFVKIRFLHGEVRLGRL